MKRILFAIFCAVALASCDSLEDTYKEFAGDGPIRYLGKCTDLSAKIGWQRLVVSWTNNPDPVIDKIKLTCTKDGDVKEFLLDKTVNTYCIDNLDDGNYEITVCSVDKDGNPSLGTTIYARPYTDKHEVVQSFTQIVSSHYFVKNRLVLFFLGWEDNIEDAYITYTKKDGNSSQLELTPALVNSLHYLLPDEVDVTKPVSVYRKGRIANCEDIIDFAPVALENNVLFNSDFKQEMKRQFGFQDDIPEKWAESVEAIEFDRNIGSFADLLNLPKLNKLVLGSNRYVRSEMIDDQETAQSKVYDAETSNFVLKVLHELNPSFIVERYDKHYSTLTTASYIKEMGHPTEPTLDYLDLKGLKFTSTPEDASFNSYVQNLTDGDITTSWEPSGRSELTTYTLDLNLNAQKPLHGMKLVQTFFEHENKRKWCPSQVKILVSDDGDEWHKATYIEELEIGNSTGETIYIPFMDGGITTQYVRVMVSTPYSASTFNISLAEIALY